MTLLSQEGFRPADVDSAIIGSVVPQVTEAFEQICLRLFKTPPLVVSSGIRTGVRVATDNPREVGADRIVNAAAAHHLYGGPAIVVDFGTATTFDVVADDGSYLGGAIAPGLGISVDALISPTARLRRVGLIRPKSAIGKDTVAAIQSGVVYGHVALVEGMVERIRREIGKPAIAIATGGLAPLVAEATKTIDRIDPDLTLVGLRLIYQLNRGGG